MRIEQNLGGQKTPADIHLPAPEGRPLGEGGADVAEVIVVQKLDQFGVKRHVMPHRIHHG